MPDKYLLKLYIVHNNPQAQRTIEHIRQLCEEELNDYELKVIDVLENPSLAEDDKIIATPTIIKVLPEPLRRLIGDLTNREKVLLGLDLVSKEK